MRGVGKGWRDGSSAATWNIGLYGGTVLKWAIWQQGVLLLITSLFSYAVSSTARK